MDTLDMGKPVMTAEDLVRICKRLDSREAYLVEMLVLKGAFDRLIDRDDWRAPISKAVDPAVLNVDMELLKMAVGFFTGVEAHVSVTPNGLWLVQSPGYRNGPAGP